MFGTFLRRIKGRFRRYHDDHENAYWQQLSDAEVRSGAHRHFVGGMWSEIGELQFDFLVAQGLRPEHRLLDVGCGALRGGLHFVRYLEPGRYFGIDANDSLVRAGRHELALAGLAQRGANLMVNERFDVSSFGAQFDFAIAISVFTHLYLNHVVRCLAEVRRTLLPNGKFYATFFEAPTAAHLAIITHRPGGVATHFDSDPYHYSFDELARYGRHVGMHAERVPNWQHPRDQRMICFTQRGE